MTYSLRVSIEAELDILEVTNYYDNINADLCDRFLAELNRMLIKIAINPQFYSYISSNSLTNFRDIKLASFLFVIIYEISNSDVIIAAVLNTHRKPFL